MKAAIGLAIGLSLAPSASRADDSELLKLMLINGSAIIGQSIACGIASARLHTVMTVQARTIEILSHHDPKVMKMRDNIIELAADNERKQVPQRCATIETAFSIFENSMKKNGLLSK